MKNISTRQVRPLPPYGDKRTWKNNTMSLSVAEDRGALRQVGIKLILAERRTEHGSGLDMFRWVVERTLSRLHQNRVCAFVMNADPIFMRP